MAGLLSFHAHPDDESIWTGGTLARYGEAGVDIVVATATDGSRGRATADQGDLAVVRASEIQAALSVLGVRSHHFLGYRDSGSTADKSNSDPECFSQADFHEATARLVDVIRLHQPEVMLIYDPFGLNGHPDHIQVHRVGLAAHIGSNDPDRFPSADGLAPWQASKVYMVTAPRGLMGAVAASGLIEGLDVENVSRTGMPMDSIGCVVDVGPWFDRKLRAMQAHRSQIDRALIEWLRQHRSEWFEREYFQPLHAGSVDEGQQDDLFDHAAHG